jgi:hypothetical protein
MVFEVSPLAWACIAATPAYQVTIPMKNTPHRFHTAISADLTRPCRWLTMKSTSTWASRAKVYGIHRNAQAMTSSCVTSTIPTTLRLTTGRLAMSPTLSVAHRISRHTPSHAHHRVNVRTGSTIGRH